MLQFKEFDEKLKKNSHIESQTQEVFLQFKRSVANKTKGKFILLSQSEYTKYLNKHVHHGNILGYQQINEAVDIAKCRNLVNDILGDSMDKQEQKKLLLMVSEAATNIIKHAYRGKLIAAESKGYLRLLFCDRGPGVMYEDVPLFLFCWGTTLKDSLGAGLILIYHYADRTMLFTTNHGTTLIIEKVATNS